MANIIPVDFNQQDEAERWQDYLSSHPDAHCTDRAEWRVLFQRLYGIQNSSFAWVENGKARGIVSLYHIRSPFLGDILVSCPFFGYGGLLADTPEIRDALLERTDSAARELGVDFIEFRLKGELPAPYQQCRDFLEFDLDLEDDLDALWKKQISSNARQNTRKALKADLDFTVSNDHLPCYGLLCRALRAHGTPFHGERFFTLLTELLGNDVRFSEVRKDGRLIAAGILVSFQGTLLTPYIGSLRKFDRLRPNYRQYWGIIEYCVSQGITRFELGRSPKDTTHVRFKKKWGTREVPVCYNYKVMKPGKIYKTVSRPTRLQRSATAVWSRMPLCFTRALGPHLFRYIP